MPKGVYPRTPNQLKAAVANLAKGRQPEAREKANNKLKERAADPEWKRRVSEGTKAALSKPGVRQKHKDAMRRRSAEHGPNFKGGNGSEPLCFIKTIDEVLSTHGFIRECVVKTKGNPSGELRVPDHYKIDFGHLIHKIAIEIDGTCHTSTVRQEQDRKKSSVLKSLGWTVIRVAHARHLKALRLSDRRREKNQGS